MEPGWRNNSSTRAVGEAFPNQCNLSQNPNSSRNTVNLLAGREGALGGENSLCTDLEAEGVRQGWGMKSAEESCCCGRSGK